MRVSGDPKHMRLPTDADVAGLAPYPHIEDDELTGCQDNVFNIEIKADPTAFTVNDHSYDPEAAPRRVPRGGAEEWRLVSKFVNHPFHIHVNPFEVQSSDSEKPHVWRDTLLVRGPKRGYADTPKELCKKMTRIRTRYRRYIGSYVLHCHILDHEDKGMMQEVEVTLHPPEGSSVDSSAEVHVGRFPGTGACGEPEAACRMR